MKDAQGAVSLDSALEEMFRLERLADGMEAAELLVSSLRHHIDRIHSKVATLTSPSVLVLGGTDPLTLGAGWKLDLVDAAGGFPILRTSGGLPVSLAEIASEDPDAIVLAVAGLDVDETLEALWSLQGDSRWLGLRAVKRGTVLVVDGRSVFGWPNSRLAEAADIVAFGLHGERSGIDVSTSDAYQEVFWPGGSWVEITDEIRAWTEARRRAWRTALDQVSAHARERAAVAFESFRADRLLDAMPPKGDVIALARETYHEESDHEQHYFQVFFATLNDLAYADRLRRRVRARLAGPLLEEAAILEMLTEAMAVHDPIGIVFYPDNVDEYSLEAKAIASMARGKDVAQHVVVKAIVSEVLVRNFSELGSPRNGIDALASDVSEILAHRREES